MHVANSSLWSIFLISFNNFMIDLFFSIVLTHFNIALCLPFSFPLLCNVSNFNSLFNNLWLLLLLLILFFNNYHFYCTQKYLLFFKSAAFEDFFFINLLKLLHIMYILCLEIERILGIKTGKELKLDILNLMRRENNLISKVFHISL